MVRTCVDPVMEELQRLKYRSTPEIYDQLQTLEVEFGFLRTLLVYTQKWSHAENGAQLGDLRNNIEAAFQDAAADLSIASITGYQVRAKYLNPLISILFGKIELFKPEVGEAYQYLFKNNSCFDSYSPLSDYELWDEFICSLQSNLKHLQWWKSGLTVPVKKYVKALQENLSSLRIFVYHVALKWRGQSKLKDLLVDLGAVAVRITHLCYLCWVNKMDANMLQEMLLMLPELQLEIKPNTPQVIEMYFGVLKASMSYASWSAEDAAYRFVDFLLPVKHQAEALHEGLIFLISFLINTPKLNPFMEDVEQVARDIKAVAKEAVSVSYSFQVDERTEEMVSDMNLALFKLLEKMELLKAETILLELLNSEISLTVVAEDRIGMLHERLEFLRTVFLNPLERKNENEVILTHIEAVDKEVLSLFNSFSVNEITADMVRDCLLKLLKNVKLFKAEAFLMELLNNCASLSVLEREQIKILQEGLRFFRTFLADLPKENPKDWRLLLQHIEALTGQAISVYYSFHGSEISDVMRREMNGLLLDLLNKIRVAKGEFREIYLQIPKSSRSNFPKTDGIGFIAFLVGNLKCLLNCNVESISSLKYQIKLLTEELEYLRSFLMDTAEQSDEHWELRDLGSCVMEVAYEAEYVIDSILLRDGAVWYDMLWLCDVLIDTKLIKARVREVYDKKTYDFQVHKFSLKSKLMKPQATNPKIAEVVVGLEDQAEIIIDRLTRGSSQLDIVSIVGMAGIGKTTLAKKVYHDPSVMFYFNIRAWCFVSQVYQKRDLLLHILSDIIELNGTRGMSDEDLSHELYKGLKGNRYLIVMDDLWDIGAWDDLGRSFPNDENGSRILFTSRLHDVVLKAKPDSVPHPLRLLSDDESWMLLQDRLFPNEGCPQELLEVGKQIAENCKGLPLAVVAIAGLLQTTDKDLDRWKEVVESVGSHIADDPERRCMDILELSYKHLPENLKACFLYFGAFVEDKYISVWKLIWLWIAEGFIQITEAESLEEVAEEYLMDLIGRSLVTVAKRRSKGGVKVCCVHDMLRDLCLAKAKEENFLQLITRHDDLFDSSSDAKEKNIFLELIPEYEEHFAFPSDGMDYGIDSDYQYPSVSRVFEQYRLCIRSKRNLFVISRPSGFRVRSLLFFASSDMYPRCPYDISFVFHNFKLLRVLDLDCINMGNCFPDGIEFLIKLRYLAVSGDIDHVPSSIANLKNLETFIVKGLKGKVILPCTIWSMTRLRHIHVLSRAAFTIPDDKLENFSILDNLVTLSSPILSFGEDAEKIIRRFPKLRKLRCICLEAGNHSNSCNLFRVLDSLTRLESLKIFYHGRIHNACKFNFPLNLKKLTLSNFCLPWNYISAIGRLPNLEVLKLLFRAFEGQSWEMTEGEFLKLRFLKLEALNIAQWNASSDHLPNLQHLVLRGCKKLEEVPPSFGDICTLEMIEVKWCSRSVEKSVRKIQEEQLELGNEGLKVLINFPDRDFGSSS